MPRSSQPFRQLRTCLRSYGIGLSCFGLIPLCVLAASLGNSLNGETKDPKPSAISEGNTRTKDRGGKSSRLPTKSCQPLTPANALLMLARCLPEMVDKYTPQLMLNRCVHERNYQEDPDANKYGVKAEYGLFFTVGAPEPDAMQMSRETARFAEWLKERGTQAGDTHRWRFTAKFSQFDKTANGYPLSEIAFGEIAYSLPLLQNTRNIQENIEALKQRLSEQPAGNSNAGFGGGGFGEFDQLTARIQTSEQTLFLLRNSPPVINLGEVNTRYRLVAPIANGNQQQGNAQNTRTFVTDSCDKNAAVREMISPALFLNSQIYLPHSLNESLADAKYEIELEFQVKAAEIREQPTKTTLRVLNLLMPKSDGDRGRCVLYYAEIIDARLLNPNSKQWHQLHTKTWWSLDANLRLIPNPSERAE